jgi:hypothetical protein
MQSAYHYQPTARAHSARADAGSINMNEDVFKRWGMRSARYIRRRRRIGRALQTGTRNASFGVIALAF